MYVVRSDPTYKRKPHLAFRCCEYLYILFTYKLNTHGDKHTNLYIDIQNTYKHEHLKTTKQLSIFSKEI